MASKSIFSFKFDIFDLNKTISSPEQSKPKCDQIQNKMIRATHMADVKSNESVIESNMKIVSFTSSDAYAKMKKERKNLNKHNKNVFLQNHGSENSFPTFSEWNSGNQNIAVNHNMNQDFAENRMRSSSCAKRAGKCEWEMFENCAIVGNEIFF